MEIGDFPTPSSDFERECFEKVLENTHLRQSVIRTGRKWGNKIADVEVSGIPKFLVGQAMLISSEIESSPVTDEIRLVIYRCDRNDHLGWPEPFNVILSFPDGGKCEFEVPPSFNLIDGHSVRIPVTSIFRERQIQSNRRIPRILFNLSAPDTKQGCEEIRRLLKNVRRITNLLQCNALYLVLNEDACQREVENATEIVNFVEAYQALRSGLNKMEIMRYYLLYKYGGVYFDDKTLIKQSLNSVVFDSVFAGVQETPCDFFISSHRSLEISFMAARPGSPIMLKALESAIANIMQREHSAVTGNKMFNQTMAQGVREEPLLAYQQKAPLHATWIRYFGEMCAILPIIRSNNGILLSTGDYLWQREAIAAVDWPIIASAEEQDIYVDDNPHSSFMHTVWTSLWFNRVIFTFSTLVGLALIAFIISRYPPIDWL